MSKSGRGRGIRTPDILLPKQARYQTALYPDIPCLQSDPFRPLTRHAMIRVDRNLVNSHTALPASEIEGKTKYITKSVPSDPFQLRILTCTGLIARAKIHYYQPGRIS